ncbi:MAG: hypothetical protein IPL46_01130 [Saprospiraceae bacterium]|nr:hypothetical protein [Saprospiraceae bacterium]
MSQLKFYQYATWSLLFLNIAVLAFFFLTKPKPPHHKSPGDFQSEVIEILHLSSRQVSTFRELAYEHHEKMKSINGRQQRLLLPYFGNLADSASGLNEEDVLTQIQQLEREKMQETYQHLLEIKNLLDDVQVPRFKDFLRIFTDRILMNENKNQPPPKDSD